MIVNSAMLGLTIGTIKSMDELGISVEPDMSYRKFAVADELSDMTQQGNGVTVITWHFNGLAPGERDILYDLLGGDLSVVCVVRSVTNHLNVAKDDWEYKTYDAIMHWSSGDEKLDTLHVLDVTVTFSCFTEIP